MEIKIMDSIDYIDEAFKRGSEKYSFDELKTFFLSYMKGERFVSADCIFSSFGDESPVLFKPDEMETNKEKLFGNLPIQDTLTQIMKYALIKSYSTASDPEEGKLLEALKIPISIVTIGNQWNKGINRGKGYRDSVVEAYEDPTIKGSSIINSIIRELRKKDFVSVLLEAFVNYRYRGFEKTGEIKDEYNPNQKVEDDEINRALTFLVPTGIENKDEEAIFGVKNFFMRRWNNYRLKLQERTDRLGKNLYASIRKLPSIYGVKEGATIKKHPKNRKFKMLAIAETRQGKIDVANFVLTRLNEWFTNLDPKYYSDPESLKVLFQNIVYKINCEIKENTGEKTSLSTAIVGKDKTLVYSLGETRAITYRNVPDRPTCRLGSMCEVDIDEGPICIDNDSYNNMYLFSKDALEFLQYKGALSSEPPKNCIKMLRRLDSNIAYSAAIYGKRSN